MRLLVGRWDTRSSGSTWENPSGLDSTWEDSLGNGLVCALGILFLAFLVFSLVYILAPSLLHSIICKVTRSLKTIGYKMCLIARKQ
jgi:hypothetical protein